MRYSIGTHKGLLDLSSPRVMAILNITPDSFYTSCGTLCEDDILSAAERAISQGADILDIGACSTRPNSTPVDGNEEWSRLAPALKAIRHHWQNIVISVDTFRADIAHHAIELGADMINDVYGGQADSNMLKVISQHKVPYVLTHSIDIPAVDNYDPTLSQVVAFLQQQLNILHQQGVVDVIIDPGFGFAKTQEQNYTLLEQLDVLQNLHTPILVGISRKSMLYKPLNISSHDALPATIAANMAALERGANILRVHDVIEARQTISVFNLINKRQ
jgi:dihydropteroate synthase